jgi:hypothetical protein
MTKKPYKTSGRLEAIVSKFRLCICEVVPGMTNKDYIFRFNFLTDDDDDGRPLIDGATSCRLSKDDNPRIVANVLRNVADHLDAYWAIVFPDTIKKGGDPMAKKPMFEIVLQGLRENPNRNR